MAPGRHAAQDLAASSAKRPARLRNCHRTGPKHLLLVLDQRLARDVDGEHANPTDQGTRTSSRCLTIAQAPPSVLDTTVHVDRVVGLWALQNDTPASPPTSFTVVPLPASQKPRPFRGFMSPEASWRYEGTASGTAATPAGPSTFGKPDQGAREPGASSAFCRRTGPTCEAPGSGGPS
jgi:hypothetical protein